MKGKTLYAAIFLFAVVARATKPCGPATWLAHRNRGTDEWTRLADWVVTGKMTARSEKREPYPDCDMEDRSKCSIQDTSTVTLEVESSEKGKISPEKKWRLKAEFCAPDPPKEIGARYKFYGRNVLPGTYLFFLKLPN